MLKSQQKNNYVHKPGGSESRASSGVGTEGKATQYKEPDGETGRETKADNGNERSVDSGQGAAPTLLRTS